MQKILDVLIKTKDDKGHIRHLGVDDIEVDSIVIKANTLEAAQRKKETEAAKKKKTPAKK